MGNLGEKTPVSQKIHVQVGDTHKHTISYARSTCYITVLAKLSDTTESIQRKFFTLPDETLVYPGHDYAGHQISTIGQEKTRNPRLGGGKTLDEFIEIMNALKLPYPRKMEFAVPGNMLCGECPPNVPEEFKGPCAVDFQG